MDLINEELKERLGESLEFNVLLKNYSSIGTGGVADYFYIAKDVNELVKSIKEADKLNIPFTIIGSGSNILFSDSGFKGMIIKNMSDNIVINTDRGEIIVDSGITISKLLNQLSSYRLGGIEFMVGIPGTIGGAIYGNAGSKNQYIGDYIKSITVLDKINGEIKIIKRSREWMEFSYRSSKLKRTKEKQFNPIILTVHMRLAQKRNDEIAKKMKENLEYRQTTQPIGEKTCGSWFKNPGKLPEQAAGYLLERSGAKKIRCGGAAVSKKHANFLINKREATSDDLKKVAEKAKELVRNNYDVELEEEIEYLGEW